MRTLKIEGKYIIVSDLKKMLEKLTSFLEKAQEEETIEAEFEVTSNFGGYLKVDYKNYPVEDTREQIKKKRK